MKPYEHRDKWVNRMVLGDSLVIMNSLLEYEGMGGQVQMIYMDPPYGVKFGSNFQPFVREREVTHNDDADFTREPEMVQAYRDTWELGLHSYLSYLRDRMIVARDLLSPEGSFVLQINDENVHHVREVMDEVFGANNFLVTIVLKKKGATTPADPVNDYILWFAKDRDRAKSKIRRIFERRSIPEDDPKFNTLISPQGEMRRASELDEDGLAELLGKKWKWARVNYPIVSQHYHNERSKPYVFNGKPFSCGQNNQWRFDVPAGMDRLAAAGRLFDGSGKSLGGVMYWDDWPYVALSNIWDDLKGEENPQYVVQTAWKAVQRCMLMTTDPGDLVLDPTCGSGTTAYVAEQWGRRWITCDASRVPLALARQRLLTSTFPWYKLRGDGISPSVGFEYRAKQNSKGKQIGGIVPRITLRSIANVEPPEQEVLVDRPEEDKTITRITGPFCFEASIPTPLDVEDQLRPETERNAEETPSEQAGSFADRMLDILRRSPLLRLEGNRTVQLHNIRPLTRTLAGLLEARVAASTDGQAPTNGAHLPGMSRKLVAIVFGPENGSISEGLVYGAAKEAAAKNYTRTRFGRFSSDLSTMPIHVPQLGCAVLL
jgi:adenine-specific DNA-methyltransferase